MNDQIINQQVRLIVFDGICNLCNGFVKFVVKRDKKNIFKFTPIQSDAAKKFDLPEFDSDSPVTIFYVRGRTVLQKSDAALSIFYDLGGIWKAFIVFRLFPRFFRNWFYDRIANNRYKMFGKRDSCMVPTPELRNKFLD